MSGLYIRFFSKLSEKVQFLLKNVGGFSFLNRKHFDLESFWRHKSIKKNLCFANENSNSKIFIFSGLSAKMIHDFTKITYTTL